MRVAVASGKGGTGKTTVATSLALSLAKGGRSVAFLDCDVEEPNAHLFLKPVFDSRSSVAVPIPRVDPDRCTGCGTCGEVCEFNAMACLGGTALVFENLCHGCGGCERFCPEGAISEVGREIGQIESGRAVGFPFAHGRLRVGEAMSPPLIRALSRMALHAETVIVDAPPGTSCPVISALRSADLVLLVTEPTPFGRHDLGLAAEMVRAMGLPFGVVLNRCDLGDASVENCCAVEGIDVMLKIPDDRRIAEGYSRGETVVETLPSYAGAFLALFDRITARGGWRPATQTSPGERSP